MLSKIIRPEYAFAEKRRVPRSNIMFRAGVELSDHSDDEEETMIPAKVGQASGRSYDSDPDNEENTIFRRAAPIYPKMLISNNDGGMRRTTSSIARLSMAIRRSLRLPRRSEIRLAREREEEAILKEKFSNVEGPSFTQNTRKTLIVPSLVPRKLNEIQENKRLNRIEKVKKIVRKTDWPVSHEVREHLWKELCNNKDFSSSKRLYVDELEEHNRINAGKEKKPQILADEGAVVNNFDLNELGTLKLMRLLLIVERLRPDIIYAPLLYPITSILLNFHDDDADCFACINYLLSNKGYILTTPLQWIASTRTILSLVKKHKSTAYAMLKRRCGTSEDTIIVECLEDWLTWIFLYLPTEYVCRVLDCYFVEGHKFLIRSAISIVYVWSKIQKTLPTPEEFLGVTQEEKIQQLKNEFKHTAQNLSISTSTFIETAVKIRNLQSSTIARLQNQHEEQLRIESPQILKRFKKKKTIFCEAFQSTLIDNDCAIELMSHMPDRLQLITPTLAYRLSQDGASFTNFWTKTERLDQTIIVIKTTKNEVFGAYLSSPWVERNDRKERSKSRYWGTGESFVFRLNQDMDLPEIYLWVGSGPNPTPADKAPQYFMTATDRSLVVGSGGSDAIRISEELTHGMSGPSDTFASPQLCKTGSFDIYELEVFYVPSSD